MPLLSQPPVSLTKPITYVAIGALILLADLFTGRHLQFPILFVIPVAMAAWFCGPKTAYSLATSLPIGRLAIAIEVDQPSPTSYVILNAAIRIAVLLFIGYWVCRNARQTRGLRSQVAGYVTMCAWSRTIEHKGRWLSFEDYLKERFHLDTTHGISPEETKRALGAHEAPPNEELP